MPPPRLRTPQCMLYVCGTIFAAFCCEGVAAEIPRALKNEFVFQNVVMGLSAAAIALKYAHIFKGDGTRTVQRVLKDFIRFGTVVMRADKAGKRLTSITDEHVEVLLAIVDEDPCLFLDEIQGELARRTGIYYTRSRIERKLLDKKYTWKVLARKAAQRDEQERKNFRDMIETFDPRCFIFIDESHFDEKAVRRRRGRAHQGKAPTVHTVLGGSDPYSLLAAMNIDGFIPDACKTVSKRGVDSEECADWLRERLCGLDDEGNRIQPAILQPFDLNRCALGCDDPIPNSILILDNASIHHNPAVLELLYSTGAEIRFLPPYSPDFNPIEEGFNNLKKWLRRREAAAVQYPEFMCRQGLE